jgi:hypothetical protein
MGPIVRPAGSLVQEDMTRSAAALDALHDDCSSLASDIARESEALWSTQRENKNLLASYTHDGELFQAKTEQYKARADAARDALVRRYFKEEVCAQVPATCVQFGTITLLRSEFVRHNALRSIMCKA